MLTSAAPHRVARGGSSSRAIRAAALLPLPLVVVGVILVVVSPVLPVLVLASALLVASLWWYGFINRAVAHAEGSLLTEMDAVEIDVSEWPRMHNLVEGLCLTMGLAKPHLWSVQSSRPFAVTVSQPGSPGSLVFSGDLLTRLDRVECEALATHMLVRLRSGDTEAVTVALALWRSAARVGLAGPVSVVLARTITVDPAHGVDAEACRITRYPPGLSSVLTKLSTSGALAPTSDVTDDVSDRTVRLLGPLMVAGTADGDAAGASGFPSLESVRLSSADRIELIKEY